VNPKGLKDYFRADPGVIFVIAFQVLLIAAATLSVLGDSEAANAAATCALFALAVGAAIQIVAVREERKHTRATSIN
jgi:hypothetical protein